MGLKVFIVGSNRHSPNDLAKEELGQAAANLASSLLDLGHSLILCSTSQRTVDRAILDSLVTDRKGGIIRFVQPDKATLGTEWTDMSELVRRSVPLTVSSTEVSGGWRPAHLRALDDCDVVVALGGSDQGTGNVLYSAEVLGRPLVSIAYFDGATKTSFRDFSRYYTDKERTLLQSKPDTQKWPSEMANLVVEIEKRNPFKTNKTVRLVTSICVAILAIGLWMVLQWNLSRKAPFGPFIPSIFLAISASAFAGIIISERSKLGKSSFGDLLELALESILIGFASLLLSELAGILLSGKTTLFSLPLDESRALLIRLSIVGFMAGVVRVEYLDGLAARAKKQFS
jgi:hypothetical protein